MYITISVISILIWMWGVGPFLMAFNAIAHSDTNMQLSNAKSKGEPIFMLRVYQFLHCVGYTVWLIGLFSIPFIVKYFL